MNLWSDDEDMTTQDLTPRETARELRKLSSAVDKVTKYLFGNGEKGMDELLRDLDTTVRNLQTSFESYKAGREKQEGDKERQKMDDKTWMKRFIITTIAVTVIPYVLSFLGWFLYWFFKMQPLLEKLEQQVK